MMKDFNEQSQNFNILNIIQTLFCRCLLIGLGLYYIIYIVCVSQDNTYYGLLVLSVVIALDTFIVCIIRNGYDFGW